MAAIGRFRLLKLLGTGGMAEVFLAHEVGTGGAERLVVIKRVLSHFAHDRKFIQMFLDEARLATRLSHPNIATVYEVGAHERQYFLSMEFVHGEDLRSLLARPELRLEACQAALIAARVAAALHHAHNLADLQGKPLHVVHRDVSPQNIRLSYEGVVKVLDFGIAKAVSNAETTQAGTVKGKYPYMSPEQAEGVVELDARSDVFSLGIVLHELLTYRRLFYGRSSQEIADAVCSKPISRPSAFDPAIPVELDR
ncbi:MAG: serine/threonine protein kinase, partial [Acidobacteriota bacterium]